MLKLVGSCETSSLSGFIKLLHFRNSVEDAHASVGAMTLLAQQSLGNNQELAQPLAIVSLLPSRINDNSDFMSHAGKDNGINRNPIPIVPQRPLYQNEAPEAGTRIDDFAFIYDHGFKCSRVYSRARLRDSNTCMLSFAELSKEWFTFSGLCLAIVSGISVTSLSLSAAGLRNGGCYGDV